MLNLAVAGKHPRWGWSENQRDGSTTSEAQASAAIAATVGNNPSPCTIIEVQMLNLAGAAKVVLSFGLAVAGNVRQSMRA
ncbi:hypothetical protein [Simiduia agarivorans]|uniref:hypothetical protein n=1 Tax=Simiduia agarivorans TaxID=447471 RepID=UPI00028BA3EC|nr:hypothetical protein [Simiduia agarivorans]